MFEIAGLTKYYGEQLVLHDFSASISAGKLSVLTGPSGSGKSTLLKILIGIEKYAAGDINFDGTAYSALSQQDFADLRLHKFGYVDQFFNFLPSLTILQNVMLPGRLRKAANTAELKVRAEGLLARFNIAEHGGKLPEEISGGQLQRASIARAMINQPKVIFADEPTGNLDRTNAVKIMQLLAQLAKDEQQTLIVVTHDLEFLDYADHHLELRDPTAA